MRGYLECDNFFWQVVSSDNEDRKALAPSAPRRQDAKKTEDREIGSEVAWGKPEGLRSRFSKLSLLLVFLASWRLGALASWRLGALGANAFLSSAILRPVKFGKFGYSLLALLVFALPIFAQDDHKKKTLEFLYSLEQKDGSYLSDAKGKADLRSTSAAIRAIRYSSGKVPHPDATAKYVASCFDEKVGGFASTPGGKVELFVTAVGLMAAAELKITKPFAEPATKYLLENAKTFEERRIAVAGLEAIQPYPKNLNELWLDDVFKTRKENGTFGDVRATGGSAAMLIRARYPLKKEDYEPIRKQLVEGQSADGGYAAPDAKTSDLETTYRVMRALNLLNAKPKDPEKLAAFVKSFANVEGGYGTPPNARDTYYSVIILYWLK